MPRATTTPPAPPIAIFHGPERFLQLHHTQALRERLIAQHGEVAPFIFGSGSAPVDILDECRALSLMQTHKLVIVDSADALLKSADDDADASAPAFRGTTTRSARELFEAYAASPDSSATLVLRAPTWRPGRLDKAVVASGGIVIKCEELRDDAAAAWAVERAPHHKATLDRAAATRLVDAVGPDLARLDTELAKLSLVRPDGQITTDVVRQFVGLSREEDFWEIQGSLLSGDAPRALGHLRELLDVSRHDPTPLLFTYCDLARKLHGASAGLANRENPAAITGRLRLWGPAASTILEKARAVPPHAAASLLAEVVDGMVRQRSGLGDPEHILEALTLRFSGLAHR